MDRDHHLPRAFRHALLVALAGTDRFFYGIGLWCARAYRAIYAFNTGMTRLSGNSMDIPSCAGQIRDVSPPYICAQHPRTTPHGRKPAILELAGGYGS